jgi:NDP-sugar pyrophosphorylase family protein
MQAMLFSAGYGSRLRPLTDNLPKALVEAGNKPLIQWNIEKLIREGCTKLVVNVHHFPEMIIDFLRKNDNFGISILVSDEKDQLLDTGGGLLKAAGLFNPGEPIVCHNVDILSNLNLNDLIRFHVQNKALATVAVRNRLTQRYLAFDQSMRLSGWINHESGETKSWRIEEGQPYTEMAFSGIHVISPEIFQLLNREGKFSIIDSYLELSANHEILGFHDISSIWQDVGKPSQLAQAGKLLEQMGFL